MSVQTQTDSQQDSSSTTHNLGAWSAEMKIGYLSSPKARKGHHALRMSGPGEVVKNDVRSIGWKLTTAAENTASLELQCTERSLGNTQMVFEGLTHAALVFDPLAQGWLEPNDVRSRYDSLSLVDWKVVGEPTRRGETVFVRLEGTVVGQPSASNVA